MEKFNSDTYVPNSVKFMAWWDSLPAWVRYAVPYIVSALLTMVQQLLSGIEWKGALITFITSLLTVINGLKAVSATATDIVANTEAEKGPR